MCGCAFSVFQPRLKSARGSPCGVINFSCNRPPVVCHLYLSAYARAFVRVQTQNPTDRSVTPVKTSGKTACDLSETNPLRTCTTNGSRIVAVLLWRSCLFGRYYTFCRYVRKRCFTRFSVEADSVLRCPPS